jgi:hypothetical protein
LREQLPGEHADQPGEGQCDSGAYAMAPERAAPAVQARGGQGVQRPVLQPAIEVVGERVGVLVALRWIVGERAGDDRREFVSPRTRSGQRGERRLVIRCRHASLAMRWKMPSGGSSHSASHGAAAGP